MMTNYIFRTVFCSFVMAMAIPQVLAFEIREYEKKIKTNYNITSVVEKISRDAIEKNLRDFLNISRPSRLVGSPGHKKSMDYIEAKLKSFHSPGSSFYRQEFVPDIAVAKKFYEDDFKNEVLDKLLPTDTDYKRWNNFTLSMLKTLDLVKSEKGYNLIWEKKGVSQSKEIIILGANYDTLLINTQKMTVETKGAMPGADNNGTGVAALLSMIEILDKLDLPKTVRIVFFDFEEFAFLGSRYYVEKISGQEITGFVNLVMLGNDSKRDDTEKKLNNMKLYLRPSNEKDLQLAHLISNNGKRLYDLIDFKLESNGMKSSSHINFWEAGYPAICLSQNWESDFNPRSHTSNDFVETLNINTYVNAFRYITGAILAWNYGIVK